MAHGEYPCIVDLETLFHEDLSKRSVKTGTDYVRQIIDESVLSVGILPQPSKSLDEKKINLLQKNSNNDLEIVADQFESIFVYQMLKQARQSKLAEGIFSSEAQDTFNNMLDMEYSEILSKKNNFGIAEALIKQFQSHVHPKMDK